MLGSEEDIKTTLEPNLKFRKAMMVCITNINEIKTARIKLVINIF
jgi:hypothetical protein